MTFESQDGTTETLDQSTPDPRFGMSADYTARRKVQITRAPTFAMGSQSSFTYEEDRLRTNVPGTPAKHTESVTVVHAGGTSSVEYTEAAGTAPASALFTSAAGRTVTVTLDANDRIDAITTPRVGGGTVAADFQNDGVGGKLSRIVVGDATSGYRVSKDLTYYATGLTDPTNGYVQTVKVGSTSSPTNATTSLLTLDQIPDAFGRTLSETVNSNQTQFQWFGASQLGGLDTPKAAHHGFTYAPTKTTYTPPAIAGVGSMSVDFNLDGQIDRITRSDDKALDFRYSTATGQLTSVVAQVCSGGTCTDDTSLPATVSYAYGVAPSCAAGVDFCPCDSSCGTGNSPGKVSSVSGPSPLTVSLGYTGSLLAKATLDKSGSPVEPLTKAELDWIYSDRLLLDAENLVVTQTSPSYGVRSAFGYDADGLPICIAQSAAGACDSSAASIATGKVEKITYDTGVAVPTLTEMGIIKDTYAYDKFNGLASIKSEWYSTATPPVPTQIYKVTYDDPLAQDGLGTRDALGRVRRKTEVRRVANGTQTTETNYTYDSSGRLWTVDVKVDGVATASRSYTYDQDGNRHFAGDNYDEQDRLKWFGSGPCGDSTKTCFNYTGAGEILSKTVGTASTNYTYDVFGNLRNVAFKTGSTPTKTVDYLVDGFGRRVGKKLGTSTTGPLKQEFVYRGTGLQIAAEIDTTTGKLKSRFFYGSRKNIPDFMERANGTSATKTYRIVSDQLGSPVLVVNTLDSSDVLLDVAYDEWGNIICRAQPNNAPDCAPDGTGPCVETKCTDVIPFGFAGGLYDPDTGLVRFGARDYDPSIGRWVSKDPILFAGGQGNLYVYVGDDPVNRIDPTGSFGIFHWAAGSIGNPGPIRVEGEVVTLQGIDASTGWYGADIFAGGVEVGGEANYAAGYGGVEVSADGTTDSIWLGEGGIGIELPFLAGMSAIIGSFRQGSGSWGFYVGARGGALGDHLSTGFGVSFDGCSQQ